MGWKCVTCKKKITIDVTKLGMVCPYCRGKVFEKERQTGTRRIKAV